MIWHHLRWAMHRDGAQLVQLTQIWLKSWPHGGAYPRRSGLPFWPLSDGVESLSIRERKSARPATSRATGSESMAETSGAGWRHGSDSIGHELATPTVKNVLDRAHGDAEASSDLG